RLGLLLAERPAPPLRPGAGRGRGDGRGRLAVRPQGDVPRPPRQPPLRRAGDEGDRRAAPARIASMPAHRRWRPAGLAGAAVLLLAAAGSGPLPQFTDVTEAVGIDFKHENSPTQNKYLLETMGGG